MMDWLAYGSMVVPFLIAHRRRHNLTGGLQTLRFVPLFLLGMYGLMHIAIRLWQYSLPVNHLNTVGETLLYLKVYHDEFVTRRVKRYIRITAAFFLAFAALDSFWLEGFRQINAYTSLLESIVILGLGLLFFERVLIRKRQTSFFDIPMFAATIGIMLYLSGTIVLYLISNDLIAKNDEYSSRMLYLTSSCLLLLMSLLFCRAFLLVQPDDEHKPTTS
ncbi:hypothetical protein [Hymenobacter amundsenii]|nr:hypothetical protein [Hymenobacter amundsenii]